MDSYGRESLRKIKSWCGQLLCLPRLIHRTFLFQKMYCQEEGKDTDEVSLVCWGALQFLILLRRMIDTSSGWVNPWFEALVRGLALLSACTVDFSGCQVDRDQSIRVWFFHQFLKYSYILFNHGQDKNLLSAQWLQPVGALSEMQFCSEWKGEVGKMVVLAYTKHFCSTWFEEKRCEME